MSTNSSNYFIFSGGPGVGKTSVLLSLRALGYRCVDEAARQILQEQNAIGGDATHWGDQAKYRDLMLARSIEAYLAVGEGTGPVFFDRGIPELLGHSRRIGGEIPALLREALEMYPYNRKVFVFPPWEEIYTTDNERKQDYDQVEAVHSGVVAVHKECGYNVVEVPRVSVVDRVEFVLSRALA